MPDGRGTVEADDVRCGEVDVVLSMLAGCIAGAAKPAEDDAALLVANVVRGDTDNVPANIADDSAGLNGRAAASLSLPFRQCDVDPRLDASADRLVLPPPPPLLVLVCFG